MSGLIRIGRYINKSNGSNQMIEKWLCLNPEIKDGDFIHGKTMLLNLDKMNTCIFYPVKKNIRVDSCNFIGGKSNLSKNLVREFNRMISKNQLSVVI